MLLNLPTNIWIVLALLGLFALSPLLVLYLGYRLLRPGVS